MTPLARVLALAILLILLARADAGLPPDAFLPDNVTRQQLPALLTSTNINVVNAALAKLYAEGITYNELAPIFKNPSPEIRLVGLDLLRHSYNADANAIGLMIPLLRDPDKNVRDADAMVLRSFTGQDIPEDQPDEWAKWWAQYKLYYELMDRARRLQQIPRTGYDFHTHGCIHYDLQNFTNALIDFRQACDLGSEVKDYSWCRLWLVEARLGTRDAATKDLETYLKQRPSSTNDWPAHIAHFLAGDITETDLLKKASIPGAEPVDGQLCEAYFYIGSKDLVDGDKMAATEYFKKCLATKQSAFEEYSSAEVELGIAAPPPKKSPLP